MTWHQHAAVIFWPNWDKLWCRLLANRSFPQEGSWFREGTCHLRVQNDIRILPSPALILLHRQIRPNGSIVLNFEIIPCSFGLFLYINWVSGHLMCIIQIWTTSTCSRAPKLTENITYVSSGEFLGPMQEMGVKFKHLGVVARPERLRNLVF